MPVKITTSRAGTPTTNSPGTDRRMSAQNSSTSRTLDSRPSNESIREGGCPWMRSRSSDSVRLSIAVRRSARRAIRIRARSSQVTSRSPYGGPKE